MGTIHTMGGAAGDHTMPDRDDVRFDRMFPQLIEDLRCRRGSFYIAGE